MASETDVCSSCSGLFDDIKSAVKCTVCDKFYHGPCEGLSDLRGFHMKRASWKCKKCLINEASVLEMNPRKRHRSQNGDIVEIDKVELLTILETMKNLSSTVEEMKFKLDVVTEQNTKLTEMVFALLDKKQINAEATTSYAAITTRHRQKESSSTPRARNVNNNPAVPSINNNNNNTPVPNTMNSPALKRPEPMVTDSADNAQFTTVKPKKKRPMKPLIIGSSELKSSDELNSAVGFTGAERRQWIYVGRVTAGTVAETVAEHVKATWSISDVICIPLANNSDLCSFKVGVRESVISSLLDASKWPKHVAIREFVQFSRDRVKRNQPVSGNFPTTSPEVQPT